MFEHQHSNHKAYGHCGAARLVGIQTFELVFKPVPIDGIGEQNHLVLRAAGLSSLPSGCEKVRGGHLSVIFLSFYSIIFMQFLQGFMPQRYKKRITN
jgi:hypothetical protein